MSVGASLDVPATDAGAVATRIIRKLPPPRGPEEAESFPRRALDEILRAFRREAGALWLWRGESGLLELAASSGVAGPGELQPRALDAPGSLLDLLPNATLQALEALGLRELHALRLPGRLIGVLALGGRRATALVGDEAEAEVVVSYLAGLLGGDLLTRRVRETDFELRYHLWELESLYDLGISIAGNLDTEALSEEILLRGLSLLNARRASLDLSADGFHRNFGGAFLPAGVLERVVAGEAVAHDGIGEPAAFPFIAVPIRTERQVLGVLAMADKEARGGQVHAFLANDLRTLSLLAAQAASALVNARMHRDALERERIEQEIQVAASIQQQILPKEAPRIAGLSLAGRTRPTRAVGGDFYDYFPLAGDRLAIVLADVSGKGIPASLLVSTLATGLHVVSDDFSDPVRSLARLDRHLFRFAEARKFVTLALAVIDPATDLLDWVSAGHNPAVLLRADGDREHLGSTGVPLGMFADGARELRRYHWRPGDRLCIYSDGITEAETATGESYELPRLEALLESTRHLPDVAVCDRIFDDVAAFAAGAPQYDDQTVVLVSRT